MFTVDGDVVFTPSQGRAKRRVSSSTKRSAVLLETQIPPQGVPFKEQISHQLYGSDSLTLSSARQKPRHRAAEHQHAHSCRLFRGTGDVCPWCSMPRVKPRMAIFLLGQWGTVLRQVLTLTTAPWGCYFTAKRADSPPGTWKLPEEIPSGGWLTEQLGTSTHPRARRREISGG